MQGINRNDKLFERAKSFFVMTVHLSPEQFSITLLSQSTQPDFVHYIRASSNEGLLQVRKTFFNTNALFSQLF